MQAADTLDFLSTKNVDMQVCFSNSVHRDKVVVGVNCKEFDTLERDVFSTKQQATAILSTNKSHGNVRLYADFTPEIVLQVPVSSSVSGHMLWNALKIVQDDNWNTTLHTTPQDSIILPRQKIAADKTGVDGWRLVRFLPPTSTTWYSGDDDVAGIRTENAYNLSKEWSVPFGKFDEFCFSTFNFKNWLYTTKDSAIYRGKV